jgi:hypothetical protein
VRRLLLTANVITTSPILVTLMMEALSSSETSVLTRAGISSQLASVANMANFVPSSLILVTLMMELLSSSETSVLTRETRRNIPDGAILHSHRRENLKSYIALTGWTL